QPRRRPADADRAGIPPARLFHASPGPGDRPWHPRRTPLRGRLRPRFERAGRARQPHPPQARSGPAAHRARPGLPARRAAVSPLRSLRGRLLAAGVLGILLAAGGAAWLLGAAFERSALDALDRRLGDDLVYVAGALARDGDGSARLRRTPSARR